MKNVIHIFGPSGSGTTTLGKALSEKPGYRLMDLVIDELNKA